MSILLIFMMQKRPSLVDTSLIVRLDIMNLRMRRLLDVTGLSHKFGFRPEQQVGAIFFSLFNPKILNL